MPPVQRSTRVNLQDFKSKFLKILGPAKENQYWSLLTSFLSFKLTKAELDKLVPSTIGKENVVLHNQFVRAIYSNATCSDAPAPPPSVHDTSKPVKGIRRKPQVATSSVSTDEPGPASPVPVIRANGDGAIPSSPRKGRSAIRDRKAQERPSPLSFHQRGEASTSQGGSVLDEETPRGLENGGLKIPELTRTVQQSPYPAEHSSPVLPLAKRPKPAPLVAGNNVSTGGDGNAGMGGLRHPKEEFEEGEENDEDEEDEEDESTQWSNMLIKPPFGIPFCIASVGAARRGPFMGMVGPLTHSLLGDGLDDECLEGSDLPDAEGMQRRMQQIAVTDNGLEGVNIETANLLNRALDIYLKRLIKAAVELGRARRSSKNREKHFSCKENGGVYQGKEFRTDGTSMVPQKQMNGAWPGHVSSRDDIAVAGEAVASEDAEKCASSVVSAMDFKVAMEMNPQLLGDEWPTLMEKIALRVFDQ